MTIPYEDEAIAFPVGVATSPPFNYWVSVASRRIGQASVSRGKQYELDTVQTGEYQATYDNRDGALSPLNTASPFSPKVTPYRPVRKRFQYPATQNMLTPNQASAGEAVAAGYVLPIDGPIAVGNTVPQVFSTIANPAVTASATAFEGSNVLQSSIPANIASGGLLIWVPGWTVLPGSPHTFSIYVRTPTGSSALSVQPVIAWIGNNTEISRVVGSTVSLPVASNTWTRLTVTGTPPANAMGAWAGVAATNSPTAAYTFQSDGLQVEYASSATAYTKPGTWYSVFTGWVERWPLRWDYSGLFNKTDVQAVDAFGYLSQSILKPPFYADVLALGPNFFYTFDQGQNAQYVTDLANKKPIAPVTNSIYGAGSLTFGNNIQSTTQPTATNPAGGGFLGGATSVATFNNASVTGTTDAATYIDLTGNGGPVAGASGYYTRLIAFRKPTGIPTANAPFLWSWNQASYSAPYGGLNGFGIAASNYAHPGYAEFFTGNNDYPASTASICDGNWHLFGVVINPASATLQNMFDGNVLGVASGVTTLTLNKLGGDTIGAGIVQGSNQVLESFAGDIAFAVEFPFALTSAQFSQLWTSFQQAYAGENSAQRYSRILGWAGYQGASNVTTGPGTKNMGPASDITQGGQQATIYSPVTGTDVQTALQNVATTENGNHFVAADGTVAFLARAARYGIFPPSVTFGENAAGGEIPYEDCAFDFDMTRVANDAQITQYVNSTVYESFNPASQAQYGTRTLTRTINSQNASECSDAANYMTYRYGNPDLRMKTLRVHVSANPTAWPSLLKLELGTRCRVMRRDLSGTIQWDGFLEQIKWSFDYDSNDVFLDLQLSPTVLSTFWQLNAMHTTLQTAVVAGALNSNTGFETGVSPWSVVGGTLAQSAAQAHTGTYSAEVTPDGTSGSNYIESELVAITVGDTYRATAWVWFTSAVTGDYSTSINWYDSTGTYLSTSSSFVSVAAATWTRVDYELVAPTGAAYATVVPELAGTPPASQVWYVDDATVVNVVTQVTLGPLPTAANLPVSAYMSYSYAVPSGTAPGGGSVNPALTLRFNPGGATQEDVAVVSLVSSGGSGGLNYTSITATLSAPLTYSHTSGETVSERLTNPSTGITTATDAAVFDSNSVLGTSTILSY